MDARRAIKKAKEVYAVSSERAKKLYDEATVHAKKLYADSAPYRAVAGKTISSTGHVAGEYISSTAALLKKLPNPETPNYEVSKACALVLFTTGVLSAANGCSSFTTLFSLLSSVSFAGIAAKQYGLKNTYDAAMKVVTPATAQSEPSVSGVKSSADVRLSALRRKEKSPLITAANPSAEERAAGPSMKKTS